MCGKAKKAGSRRGQARAGIPIGIADSKVAQAANATPVATAPLASARPKARNQGPCAGKADQAR